jgi:ankyrin repeat protein
MGNVALVQLLLENGADTNARHGIYGSALHVASLEGHYPLVQLLVEYKADLK